MLSVNYIHSSVSPCLSLSVILAQPPLFSFSENWWYFPSFFITTKFSVPHICYLLLTHLSYLSTCLLVSASILLFFSVFLLNCSVLNSFLGCNQRLCSIEPVIMRSFLFGKETSHASESIAGYDTIYFVIKYIETLGQPLQFRVFLLSNKKNAAIILKK